MEQVVSALILLSFVLYIVSLWALFKKAGYNGWESVVPLYNLYITFRIIQKPSWWIFLIFVPFINIYIIFSTFYLFSKAFNADNTLAVLSIFFPFVVFPILTSEKYSFKNADLIRNYSDDTNKESTFEVKSGIHPQKTAIIISSILGITSAFLPWATNVPFLGEIKPFLGSSNGLAFEGILVSIAFGFAFLMAVSGKLNENIPSFKSILISFIGVIITITSLIQIYKLDKASKTLTALGFSQAVEIGIGLWILLLSGILITASVLLKNIGRQSSINI